MDEGEVIYLDDAVEIRPAGDAIHVVARSGRRVYRFAMSRRSFHVSIDRALGLLTGPPGGSVVDIHSRRAQG